MAEQGCTVKVSGLPTDLDEDRLKDKLSIHFLRSKNGGGEIASVTIVTATPPGYALVTFEDSRVAWRVLQHGRHVLEVDGKKYELALSELPKNLELNTVILSMSVTVDYSQLPGKKAAVNGLDRKHDIQIHFKNPETHCTLTGLYSHVQAALGQLLGLPGAQASKDTPPPVSVGAVRVPTPGRARRTHSQKERERNHGDDEPRPRTDQALGLYSADLASDARGDIMSRGQGWGREEPSQVDMDAGNHRQNEQRPLVEEDISLIMDADIFLYLQSHCGEEYHGILTQHGVEVVDVTADGVTTLFLQRKPGAGDFGQEMGCLKGACEALSRIYQEKEARLRRAQLSKSILSPRGGLSRAMESLRVRLPELLLSEDDRNVYIVGGGSDVSDAKQYLILGGKDEAADDVAGLLRSPSSAFGSSIPWQDERLTPAVSAPAGGALDPRIDRLLKGYEADRMADGARGYKFAPRFKASGAAGLGTRTQETVNPGDRAANMRPGLGPMLGYDLFGSARAGLGVGGLSRPGTESRGEDILVKTGDPLFTPTSIENKHVLGSISTGARQHRETPLFTSALNTLSVGAAPVTPSESTLKRASSFSGRPRSKVQDLGQSEAGKVPSRTQRSNSLDRHRVCAAKLTIPKVLWSYMKDTYRARIDDVTSDLKMSESQSEGSGDVTVVLKGAESSVLSTCQSEMQKLVAMVQADFCVQQLTLAELGVSDPDDETLEVCCDEVRRRFKKVSVQTMRGIVFLIGPEHLCSQVGLALREVFPGEADHSGRQEDFYAPSTSSSNQSIPSQVNGVQNPPQFQTESLPRTSEAQKRADDVPPGTRDMNNTPRSDSNKRLKNSESEHKITVIRQSPARGGPVTKEKVDRAGVTEADGSKTDTSVSHSAASSEGRAGAVNGGGSVLPLTTNSDTERNPRPTGTQTEDSRPASGAKTQEAPGSALEHQTEGQACICVCGESGPGVTRTGCGVALCQRCLLNVHVHCRVCPKTEAPGPHGILGNMCYSEMPFSLPGYSRDTTVKITYCIPDGIQAETHPSPGSAFRGGVFEAFFPRCEKTTKLLPRLESAFRLGLTFTVKDQNTGARISWGSIPHKTSLQGGKSGNGYPDSTYLSRLSQVLRAHGIEEAPAKSPNQTKTGPL
ncbi:hypothetical protein DPEC_G00277120 [Dallia pectoralis]|uniref:Uncharacterized protein n=1 Tax=Dallia pectoralis TaxID=75939 RepID=A0ACC2FLR3_DALPE|nr:hypothetical protein DPEC_G00277120 [Dallia pectoralis]